MPVLAETNVFIWDLVVSAALITITVVFHAIMLDRIMALIEALLPNTLSHKIHKHFWKMSLGVLTVLGLFLSHTIQVWLWAFVYYYALQVPDLPTLETAVYFSVVTYTTVGYGDIVIADNWRVLSGIEAANGLILIGWSTAFLFEVMRLIYPRRSIHI